jgi:hypothetical protein
MFEIGRAPGIGSMAVRAVIGAENMVRRLARHNPVVMTTDATT